MNMNGSKNSENPNDSSQLPACFIDRNYDGKFTFRIIMILCVVFWIVRGCMMPFDAHRARQRFYDEAHERRLISNIHTIQIALYRYREDHDSYPSNANLLSEVKNFRQFPRRGFSGEGKRDPMKPIELGDSDFEGNFTYVPLIEDDLVYGFYLIGYGFESTPGEDVNNDGIPDHVIIVVNSAEMSKRLGESMKLPSLESVLNSNNQ